MKCVTGHRTPKTESKNSKFREWQIAKNSQSNEYEAINRENKQIIMMRLYLSLITGE